MNKKLILSIITVISIIGAVSLYSYNQLQNKPSYDQSAVKDIGQKSINEGWLKYENNDFNFTMYYPSDWSSGRYERMQENAIIFTPSPSTSIGLQIEQIYVYFVPNPNNKSSLDYFKSEIEPGQTGSPCTDFKINKSVPKSLDEFDVTIVEGLCGVFNENPTAIINHKNNYIVIQASFDLIDNNNRISYKLFYDILSKIELR